MKYPAYSEYKDSGVQWLGDVPKHWEVQPLKNLVSTPITDGPHETPEIYNEGIPFVSAEAINNGKINFDRIRGHISKTDHKRFSQKYKPKVGDIYMVKSGATTGRVAMVETDQEFNIWSPLAAIRCSPDALDRHFAYHYLHSKEFQTGVQLHWSFGTQQNIGMGVIQNLEVPVPSLDEQTAIAEFLDRETGRIDALVQKKKELVERLKEKRSALISRTVTKGLPAEAARAAGLEPHTAFKPSGIEWLGDIPDGWGTVPFKYSASIITGYAFSSDDFVDEGIPILRIGDITPSGQIDFSNAKYLPADYGIKHGKFLVKKNDIVMAMTGATIGKAGRYLSDEPALLNQRVCIFRPQRKSCQNYVWYLLKANFYLEHISLTAFGGAQPNISDTDLLDCIMPNPDPEEQTAIAGYLDRETAALDRLTMKVGEAITRLQEYRAALITAAVTGKIKVDAASCRVVDEEQFLD